MRVSRSPIICLATLSLSLTAFPAPAQAQFEEPDTISRFAIGPSIQAVFRGKRGVSNLSGTEISFSGSPAFGARVEYELTRTLILGAAASYSSPEEELKNLAGTSIPGISVTLIELTGEALLRVKPNIPGYFILGGGVRLGDPGEGAVEDESFTEPVAILGAGLQPLSRRHWAARLEFRLHFDAPADQPGIDMEGLATDFSIGLGVIYRP